MLLCDPRTTHIKTKAGPCHPLLLAAEEERSCSIHSELGKEKIRLSWVKEGYPVKDTRLNGALSVLSQGEEQVEGDGKQKGEDTWNSGNLEIWELRVQHLCSDIASSLPAELSASFWQPHRMSNLPLATPRLRRAEPQGYTSLAPGEDVHRLPIHT